MSEPLPLGNFELGGRRFAGQVSGAGVRELPIASTADLLDDWEGSARLIASISAGPEHELASLRILPPVQPRQILQAGANYRKHVVGLVVAQGQHSREDAEKIMDERARSGRPYLFLGLPTSVCGAYDDVVLPRAGTQHDWELELAIVIGRRRPPCAGRYGTRCRRRLHDLQRPDHPRPRVPPRRRRDRRRLGGEQVRAHLPADRSLPGARRARA